MNFDNVVEEIKSLQEQIELNKLDTRFEKNKLYDYLGEKVVRIFRKYNVIVAGGMITSLFTGKEINDVDVYFRSEKDIAGFVEEMWGKHVASHTKKATLFMWGRGDEEVLIQAIHFKYFDTPQEVFNTFDFTHVMGAYDFKAEEFTLHKDFLKHNAQRILKFNKYTAFPLISLIRTNKYTDRGYSISKPELMRIVMTCMNMEIDSYEELKDQLGGMYGEAYENAFTELEKEEEFSLDKAIDKLQDLAVSKDYFKRPKQIEFNNMDDLIGSICNVEVKWFEYGGNKYRIRYDGSFDRQHYGDKLPEGAIKVNPKDYLDFKKVYKFVEKKDDKLVSFYRNTFEYKIGEDVSTDNKEGLFFNNLENIADSTYANYNNRVLIEAEVSLDDLINLHDTHLQYSKCKVLREVPDEEYKEFI